MVIFKQAMSKYLKSPSTWIILILSLLISGFLAGYLPFDATLTKGKASRYGYSVLMSTGVMTTMVSMFSSVFAGFKGASMFRDEIESGTFLVLLSKPISRTKIIFQKWLALQAMMILYAVANIIIYEIVVACVDNFDSLKYVSGYGTESISKNIFTVCGYMFLVLFTMGLIFSSIAMIISTKLSAATTIGISIGIGVIIPITGMIGAFTQKQEYTQLNNQTAIHYKGFFSEFNDDQATSGLQINNKIIETIEDAFSFAEDPEHGIYNIGLRTSQDDKFDSYFGLDLNYQLELLGALSSETIVPDKYKQSLTSMGIMSQLAPIIKVKKDTSFDYSQWDTLGGASKDIFDKLVVQSSKLVEAGNVLADWLQKNHFFSTTNGDFIKEEDWIVSDKDDSVINNLVGFANNLIHNPIGLLLSERQLAEGQKDTWNNQIEDLYNYNAFLTALKTSTGFDLLSENQNAEDTYGYLMNIVANDRKDLIYTRLGDYVPKRTLLWCYLAFALGLVPISLLIMRKKDFR